MTEKARPANIVLISHKFQVNDGQGRVNYEVVKAALQSDYRVTVLATSCAYDLASHPNCEFVKIGDDSLPSELLRNVVFAQGTARWIRKNRNRADLILANGFITWEPCDIVVAHFVHAGWYKSMWYPFKNFKPYSLYQLLYTTLNIRWEKKAFTRARRVIAVSRPLVDELIAIGVDKENIDVVWNGVSTDQFQPGEPDRAMFCLPPDAPIALFVGDIRTPRKNLDTVLQALQSVLNLHLAVAGSLKNSPYPAMARELGVSTRVHFLGKVSEVPLLMRSVDMFVFPSRYEAHPLVLLEAMASGLPNIVSGNFGAQEFIKGGGIILDDPNNAVALATAMNTLASKPEVRAQIGADARESALEMQWSACTRGYMAIFEKLLKRE